MSVAFPSPAMQDIAAHANISLVFTLNKPQLLLETMTDNQQSGMQPTQTIDMCHFLIDLLTLSNEAGQEQIQLRRANSYLQ